MRARCRAARETRTNLLGRLAVLATILATPLWLLGCSNGNGAAGSGGGAGSSGADAAGQSLSAISDFCALIRTDDYLLAGLGGRGHPGGRRQDRIADYVQSVVGRVPPEVNPNMHRIQEFVQDPIAGGSPDFNDPSFQAAEC